MLNRKRLKDFFAYEAGAKSILGCIAYAVLSFVVQVLCMVLYTIYMVIFYPFRLEVGGG